MLACAGPSRPHTCVPGSPGRGGWGGQRSPLWATATGPGLFRSLGFKTPVGTGFLEVNIQPYSGWEGWAAPRRLHVWCVCLRVRLFPVPSSSTSQKAAAQVAAHPALAVREVVRVPGSVVSHRSLRIPDGTSCRPVRVQVAARTAAGVCGSCVSLFGGIAKGGGVARGGGGRRLCMGPGSRGKQSRATQAGENFAPEPVLLSTPGVCPSVNTMGN